MKIIILSIISAMLSFLMQGQTPAERLFDKYAENDGFSTVYITKHMFKLFAKDKNNTNDDFLKIISGLESIKILTVTDSILNLKINLYKEIMKDLPVKEYKELMVVKSKGQDLKMLINEKNGKISEFLLISGGKENLMISITGNIDLNSISKLSKEMNIEGLENVNKMKNDEKK